MKKIIHITLAILLAIGSGIYIVALIQFQKDLESQGLTGIGKTFSVEVTGDSDYSIFNDDGDFDLWNKSERDKMVEYMKQNNLRLKPGTYEINQAYTFKKSLEVFELE